MNIEAPLKILLVEDDPQDHVITCTLLEEAGIHAQVDWVRDNDTAIERIRDNHYHLFLVDFRLGAKSGLDFIQSQEVRDSRSPAIMLTGTVGDTLADEALHMGAVDYLVKGKITPDGLFRAIRYALARKQHENALKESETRLRIALNAAQMAVWEIDLSDYTISGGDRLDTYFGFEARLEPRPLADFLDKIHPDDRECVAQAVFATRTEGEEILLEYRVARPDGIMWLLSRGVVQRRAPEDLLVMVGGTLDITGRKLAEERAKEAAQQKDEFLAMLSHELRNPLGAISNAVRIARSGSIPDRLEWPLALVERQTNHLSRLIDDLLDVSRITQGKIELRKHVVELRGLIARAVENVRPMMEERQHRFTVAVLPEPVWILADPARIEQALTNLLVNAAKYTETGGEVVVTEALVGTDVSIRVRDNGVGIPFEMQPHVFELFKQVERSLARAEGGLGIGLTLVQRIAQLHGGSVSVHSAGFARGSEFVITFPIAERPGVDPRAGEAPYADVSSDARRVLVVDDNLDNVETTAMYLRMCGHDVRTATSGPEALEAAASFEPEVVVLDIGLPGMDGYEVAKRLRSDPVCASSLILAVSGYGQEQDVRHALTNGFDSHLTKPVSLEKLAQLVSSRADNRASNPSK